MRIRNENEFPIGYTEIGAHRAETLMDFGILRLAAGQAHRSRPGKERAFILLGGQVELAWEGQKVRASRESLFDQSPWCLSLPSNVEATISAIGGEAEISVHATQNPRPFPAHLYTPEECTTRRTREREHEGNLHEDRPYHHRGPARFILQSRSRGGDHLPRQVVQLPSASPPASRRCPTTGSSSQAASFGLCQIGEEAYLLRNRDTVIIPPGAVHPHAAAPGYAMFYIWVIRHLDGARYGTPTFVPEHSWVMDPKAKIWGP